ncbi:MAG: hypothetical protein AAF747_02790 [Planctomycetota bacterium]
MALRLTEQDTRDQRILERRDQLAAEREAARKREGAMLIARLVVAFVLVIAIGVLSFVILPQYGLKLHPAVPLVAFAAIFAGAVLTGRAEGQLGTPSKPKSCDTDGRAVGCCPGPQLPRFLRDK